MHSREKAAVAPAHTTQAPRLPGRKTSAPFLLTQSNKYKQKLPVLSQSKNTLLFKINTEQTCLPKAFRLQSAKRKKKKKNMNLILA